MNYYDKIIMLLIQALEETIDEISDETLLKVTQIVEKAQAIKRTKTMPKLKVLAKAA